MYIRDVFTNTKLNVFNSLRKSLVRMLGLCLHFCYDFVVTLHSVTTRMTKISSFIRSRMSAIMNRKACDSKLIFYVYCR